ncbi:MAG: 1-acyl-sn-glycerol-3-phosphate acyltransferase [Candidatus Omnitrophica bacterium]|nr:1-acyl-sn-glycerol-3-phosphate acyltransferase [Candidatus Omnitrophota bacterium]
MLASAKSLNLITHRFNPIYFFLRLIGIYFVGPFCFHLKVNGAHNIPRTGGFVFVSNHRSHLDPVMLGLASPRMLSFMARDSLFQNRAFSWFIKSLNANPIKREKADLGALKLGMRLVSEGKGLAIFPEGTRSVTGELQRGKPGVSLLALKSGVPVIPAWIEGTQNAMPRNSNKIHFAPVTVTIGPPVRLDDLLEGPLYRETYEEALKRVMAAIKALCPA